ncbi:MAG: hypothetical protein FH756_01680 [Firmicutes bacterium]|nr:hypothetical protein [Bacillota bacterium]
MQRRVCPNCGMVWHSADSSREWVCEKCGGEIPVPEVDQS